MISELLRKPFGRRHEDSPESLESFLEFLYSDETIDPLESKKNIENSVFELRGYIHNRAYIGRGNGIFITPDGYFLTARHSMENPDIFRHKIIYNGKKIDAKPKFYSEQYDLALGKADISLDERELIFNISNRCPKGRPISLLTSKNGRIKASYGTMICEDAIVKHPEGQERGCYFYMEANHGDSGGVLVDTSNNSLIGIIVSGFIGYGDAIGMKISDAGKMIEFYPDSMD